MKITFKKELDLSQPAIDTLCDNCGAIYDLFDCSTCACGVILCPDCSCESFREIDKPSNVELQINNVISRVFNQ